ISACASLRPFPEATDQKIFCMLAGRVLRTGIAGDHRARVPRTYILESNWTRRARLRSVFLPRRANCDSHKSQQARTSVWARPRCTGSFLPLTCMKRVSEGIFGGAPYPGHKNLKFIEYLFRASRLRYF